MLSIELKLYWTQDILLTCSRGMRGSYTATSFYFWRASCCVIECDCMCICACRPVQSICLHSCMCFLMSADALHLLFCLWHVCCPLCPPQRWSPILGCKFHPGCPAPPRTLPFLKTPLPLEDSKCHRYECWVSALQPSGCVRLWLYTRAKAVHNPHSSASLYPPLPPPNSFTIRKHLVRNYPEALRAA